MISRGAGELDRRRSDIQMRGRSDRPEIGADALADRHHK